MARPRKITTKASPSSADVTPISEKDVWKVLDFANSLYQGIYPNVFSPELINSRFKDITMNPQVATLERVISALSNPKESEQELIGYSQWLELNSMLMKRLMLYLSGMMSFDLTYVCTNIKKEDEYESSAYRRDIQIVSEFFDKFDYKDAFKTVMREILRNETYFGILRDDAEKYVLQELNQQYCKLTGRFSHGLVFDFNCFWLMQPSVDINMYPSIFKRFYKEAFMNSDGTMKYNPSAGIDSRTGTYVYWTQTSPLDGFVAFKFFPEIATNIPFFAPFMPEAVTQPLIRSLQMDNNIASALKIISGEVPFLKEQKSNVKDAIALDPVTLGKFLALVKSSLPNAIKVVSAPLNNIEAMEFKGDNAIYDDYLSTAAASSGINSRLLYSKDRMNVLETKISVEVDTNLLKPLYAQFSNILEFWINRLTKKYKFKFFFEGFETGIDRDSRFERVSKLAEQGIVLYQKYASALGLSPFDFMRMMEEGRASKFVDKLTPIIKSSQMPAEKSGAPKKNDSSLSDGGSDTRDAGSDDEKQEGD